MRLLDAFISLATGLALNYWRCIQTLNICGLLQGFAKAMLDVADNLDRAVGMVEGRSQSSEEIDLDKTSALLTSLHDGVKLTDKILLQVSTLQPVPMPAML